MRWTLKTKAIGRTKTFVRRHTEITLYNLSVATVRKGAFLYDFQHSGNGFQSRIRKICRDCRAIPDEILRNATAAEGTEPGITYLYSFVLGII